MVRISRETSESLSEYLILPDWVNFPPEKVSLRTRLGNMSFQYPWVTARMQSVVGPEMAVTAGRNGIFTVVPRSLRSEDKQEIIDANNNARLKEGDIEYLSNPVSVQSETTLDEVLKTINRTGYSVIPVMDRFSKLSGVYVHDPDHPPMVSPDTPIKLVMNKLTRSKSKSGVFYLRESEKFDVAKVFENYNRRFIPIVDGNNILKQIAFLNDFDTNFIGIAVGTRSDWKEEIEIWGPQVDTLMIDSSNACFDDALKILKYAKKKFPDKPFGIGNIVRGLHFKKFAEKGADYLIAGMGVGSICKTGSERGNGRGQFTVAKELSEARSKFFKNSGRYVPLIIDGGIRNVKDMAVALAFADFIMMGNYFNGLFESPARKFDINGNVTSEEANIAYVETWGEGHPMARLVSIYGIDLSRNLSKSQSGKPIERYGHLTISGSTVEGVLGRISYKGRLRPNVEKDARYLRTTISNTGAGNLEEFRQGVVLERVSQMTLEDMLPHSIEIKDNPR